MFSNLNSSLSCLSNQTGWEFDNSNRSSLTILSRSLQSNQTYQFMVQMQHRQDNLQQATGYLLVNVEGNRPPMIVIG